MFSTSTRTPIGLDIGRRFIKAVQLRGNELVAAACIRRMHNGYSKRMYRYAVLAPVA